MARTRHIFPTTEIPHLWAHKVHPSATNPQRNLFFDGDTIYSYRHDFPLATHITGKGRSRAVLVNTDTYSVTTSKHQSMVRRAAPGYMFEIPSSLWFHNKPILKFYAEQIRELADKAKRSRTYVQSCLNELNAMVNEANLYAELHGLATRFRIPADVDIPTLRGKANTRADERMAKAKEAITPWINGENPPVSFYGLPNAYMRLTPDGSEVQTTLGARVPAHHVKRAMPFVVARLNTTEYWHTNGHKIHLGHYTLESIDPNRDDNAVVVGCHHFSRAEVLRFAAVLENAAVNATEIPDPLRPSSWWPVTFSI